MQFLPVSKASFLFSVNYRIKECRINAPRYSLDDRILLIVISFDSSVYSLRNSMNALRDISFIKDFLFYYFTLTFMYFASFGVAYLGFNSDKRYRSARRVALARDSTRIIVVAVVVTIGIHLSSECE